MKLALVGQQEYYACHYESDIDSLFDVYKCQLKFDAPFEYYEKLIEFAPDVTIVFRGELISPAVISRLSGVKIAYSTEPFPKIIDGDVMYTVDSLGRFKHFLGSFNSDFDYIFHYDESSKTFLESQGVFLSGFGPLPIATDTYIPIDIPKNRQIVFLGRSSEHREKYLGLLKREFDVLHLAHGWPGLGAHSVPDLLQAISGTQIVLNIHAEPELSWEPRVQQMLSCGSLLLSEKISPNKILEAGVDYLEFGDPWDLYQQCEEILKNSDLFDGVRLSGLHKVQANLSAKIWFPMFVNKCLSNFYGRAELEKILLNLTGLEYALIAKELNHLSILASSNHS